MELETDGDGGGVALSSLIIVMMIIDGDNDDDVVIILHGSNVLPKCRPQFEVQVIPWV